LYSKLITSLSLSLSLSIADRTLQKLRQWYFRMSPVELWLDQLRHAEKFEDWQEAALQLDVLLGLDMWYD
jgi:hypothetical protein